MQCVRQRRLWVVTRKSVAWGVIFLCCLWPVLVMAACGDTYCSGSTCTATDASYTHVNGAIQEGLTCAGSTITVNIPSDTKTWTSKLTADVTSKNLTIVGAGTASTVITPAYTGDGDLTFNVTDGYLVTVKDIGFNLASSDADYVILVSGSGSNVFRFTNLAFTNGGGSGSIWRVSGDAYGVIDTITATGAATEIVNIVGSSCATWTEADGRGTVDAVFLEDSTITWNNHAEGRPLADAQQGGRIVLRYLTVTNGTLGNHGADSGQGKCSGLLYEVYHNTFTMTNWGDGCTWNISGGGMRGGQVLMHNNTWDVAAECQFGVWGAASNLKLSTYRDPTGANYYPAWNYACQSGNQLKVCSALNSDWSGTFTDCKTDADCGAGTCKWKLCSGSSNQGTMTLCESDGDCTGQGTCSFYLDGGTSGSGAPCFQQSGRGLNNTLVSCYEWNNTYTGSMDVCASPPCNVNFVAEGSTLVENTDYYNDTDPGYTTYTYPHPLRGAGGGETATGTHRGVSIGGGVLR